MHCTCLSWHTIQINIFQAIESTISWLMTVPICRSLTKAIVTRWSATKRWSEQIVPHSDVFFISTFLKQAHLMIVHLFLTLHTGIALNWGPLQCLQFMNFSDKDLTALHDQISTSPDDSNRFNVIEAYQTEVSSSTFPIRRRPTKDGPHWWAITPSKVKHFPSPSVRPLVMWSPF